MSLSPAQTEPSPAGRNSETANTTDNIWAWSISPDYGLPITRLVFLGQVAWSREIMGPKTDPQKKKVSQFHQAEYLQQQTGSQSELDDVDKYRMH